MAARPTSIFVSVILKAVGNIGIHRTGRRAALVLAAFGVLLVAPAPAQAAEPPKWTLG